MREATQTRPWLQQLGGKSKAERKATKSKATKSKAKSDTSPATPEGQSIQHEFTKWYLYLVPMRFDPVRASFSKRDRG